MDYLILILWFILLIKWADILVDGSSSIAKRYNISNLVIWLTIIAFWTSAPELVVSLFWALWWNSDISISNIVWSNISNILLILWLTSIIYPISMPSSTVRKEIPFLIFITFLFYFVLYDNLISFLDGFLFIIIFFFFLYYVFKISKNKSSNNEQEIEILPLTKSLFFVFFWLAWLIYWWKLIVDSAVSIASIFWVPNSFIWVTIIAIWTSLPELASSLVAAFKKNTDMAIWWVIGSNIFNILWILWLTSVIQPLNWYESLNIDLLINIVSCLLLFLFAFTFKSYYIDRKEGFLMFFLYIIYISYLVYSL